jgi:hypothetical protein
MIYLPTWTGILVGMGLIVVAVFLTIWWKQHTFQWTMVLTICLIVAPLLSWWSGEVFVIEPYRAGCDALCVGYRGAPIATYRISGEGAAFSRVGFAVNSLVYLVLALSWSAVLHAVLARSGELRHNSLLVQALLWLVLVVGPLALSPLFLPPPQAKVRGDPQRIAINAQREVYLYDQEAEAPVLQVGLQDVRPRSDGQEGMRVCLRAYTFFYLPAGNMFLDMTPEGVHSNAGGVLPNEVPCWP